MITKRTFGKALIFAVNAHQGQYRKGDGSDYITHPLAVRDIMLEVKGDSSNIYYICTGAILHDVVEDTDITLEKIREEFGYSVAFLVEELTNDIAQIRMVGKKSYLAMKMYNMSSYALCIKLADRLHNCRDVIQLDNKARKKIKKETKYILRKLIRNRKKLTGTHKKLIKLIKLSLKTY